MDLARSTLPKPAHATSRDTQEPRAGSAVALLIAQAVLVLPLVAVGTVAVLAGSVSRLTAWVADDFVAVRIGFALLWAVGATALFLCPLLLARELGLPPRWSSLDHVGGKRARVWMRRAAVVNLLVAALVPLGVVLKLLSMPYPFAVFCVHNTLCATLLLASALFPLVHLRSLRAELRVLKPAPRASYCRPVGA